MSFNCQHECNEGFVKPVAAAVPGAPVALVALAAGQPKPERLRERIRDAGA